MAIKSRLVLAGKMALIALVLAAGAVWYLLNGAAIANFQPVMKFRQYYYFNLPSTLHIKTSRLPFSVLPIQTVTVSQAESELYVYAFFGRFEKIDPDKGILYLKDKGGMAYGFKYAAAPAGLGYYETVEGKQTQKFLDFGQTGYLSREEGFNPGDVILIYWADDRKLAAILAAAAQGPENLLNRDTAINHYQQIVLTGR